MFIEPPHPADGPPLLTVCQLILAYGASRPPCSGPYNSAPGFCSGTNGFILNGKPAMLSFDEVRPQDIIGLEVYATRAARRLPPPPTEYDTFIKSMTLCPVVVWTK